MSSIKTLPKRKDSDSKYQWKLEDIFQSDTQWKETLEKMSDITVLEQYKGTLSQSAQQLFDCLTLYDEVSSIVDKLYVYAFMRFHEDSTNTFYQNISNQAESLLVQYTAKTSFIIPEIIEIPENVLTSFLEQKEELRQYKHFLHNITRQKSHTLSAREEEILAKTQELSGSAQNIFVMLNDADIKFPVIQDENGNQTELTKGRYVSFLESSNRQVRKDAFTALYFTYLKQKNTLTSIYQASVKNDVFYADIRKYPSALNMALADDHIPPSVYTNLIKTVHESIPLLHRYVALRKKILGVKELHMYDLYAPLVPELDFNIEYEKAKQTVIEALSVLGKDYTDILKKGFDSGWIDVYENEGKRSGAYSWGTSTAHPYVLLNYTNTINNLFTVAHEMGHALHSYFTWKKQPYIYSGHKIFVAEVASTCNEALLMEYLLKNTTDITMQKYLINYFMEQFRGTFFRQTMFAEFEMITHEMIERGEPLTCEKLMEIYHNLNRFYFGDDIVIDNEIDIEWARIPHFYNAFYVYQYATGYCAAIALSRNILTEGKPAVERYLDFLSKGNSQYSIDLLKDAGIDMTSPQPLKNAMTVFESLLNQMETF